MVRVQPGELRLHLGRRLRRVPGQGEGRTTEDRGKSRRRLLRRATAGALVAVAMVSLAAIGYASSRTLLEYTYGYQYQYCTNPSQDQYCSTTGSTASTSTTTTTPQPVLDCFDKRSAARDEPEVRVERPGGGHFEQCELRISDVTKTESNSGLKGFTFKITLNQIACRQPCSLSNSK